MKKYVIMFVFFKLVTVQAQNAEQLDVIKKASDRSEVTKTTIEIDSYLHNQELLLQEFKSDNKNYQRVIYGMPVEFIEDSSPINNTINTSSLFQNAGFGYNLTGDEIVFGVWDGGRVRDTHVEFSSRLIIGDIYQLLSVHATHVTGIIMARGVNPQAKGIAENSTGIAYYWDQDLSEMSAFGQSGYLVSNHSYGYNVGGFPNWRFGKYDDTSQRYDQIMRTFPYYQIVTAAGNDRNDNSLNQVLSNFGYDLLTGKGCSKNALVVAAVNTVPNYLDSSSVIMSSFSNWGPTDDGRIKPDIAAQGVQVLSTSSSGNSSYTTLSGTSMSSPGIAGLLVLLQQHHNIVKGEFMKSSLVRGLLCHTAREAGFNTGPDYEFGWGLANGLNAADCISDSNSGATILELHTLNNNSTFTKEISINSVQDLKVTISWTDIAGAINNNTINDRSSRLINNLDLKVLKNGEVFYPWRLDPEFPGDAAMNDADNNADNIEMVEIADAQPGLYTIEVRHKGVLQGGNQEFSLVGSGSVTGFMLDNANYNFEKSIFIYPNPVQTSLNFDVLDNQQVNSISIFDVSGKQISSANSFIGRNSIDVSMFSAGVYFVRFMLDNKVVTKKFIKL